MAAMTELGRGGSVMPVSEIWVGAALRAAEARERVLRDTPGPRAVAEVPSLSLLADN
jgi:hypothetical protein